LARQLSFAAHAFGWRRFVLDPGGIVARQVPAARPRLVLLAKLGAEFLLLGHVRKSREGRSSPRSGSEELQPPTAKSPPPGVRPACRCFAHGRSARSAR